MSPMKFLFGFGHREHKSGNKKWRVPIFGFYYANKRFTRPGIHFQYAHPGKYPGPNISSWRIVPLPK